MVLLLIVTCSSVYAQVCPIAEINPSNNKAEIIISTAAIEVLNAEPRACSAVIQNTGNEDVMCLPSNQGNPTASVGFRVTASKPLNLGYSARFQWKCIAVSLDSTVTTARERQ